MEFTVFTSAGGFREFIGDSEYQIGEQNGCLYAVDGNTGQVVTYGPMAWSSVQEWQREGDIAPPAAASGGARRRAEQKPVVDEEQPEPEQALTSEPVVSTEPIPVPVDLPALPRPQHLAMPEREGWAPPRQFDPLSDPLERFAEG